MSDLDTYLWVSFGVAVAVLFPVLAALIRKEFPRVAGVAIPPWVKRYLILLAFSLITGVIALAIWKSQNPTVNPAWYTAFLIGFAWESAIEKFARPTP
jgi:hypothetical protein